MLSEFYPTPKNIIETMISKIENFGSGAILDPSAGKGDILDYIKKKKSWYKNNLYCIEPHPELQMILREKGYKLLANDFLTYYPSHLFDLILMNPPFSNGVKHLLHAWDIIKSGEIVCLLNQESYDNPYTAERKLIKNIISENGDVEPLGNCFTNSERHTDVNILLVHLKKDSDDAFHFDFNSKTKEKSIRIDASIGNEIATRDVIGNMVTEYEAIKKLMAEVIPKAIKIKYHMENIISGDYPHLPNYLSKALSNIMSSKNNADINDNYNYFIEELKAECWESVFMFADIEKHITNTIKKKFREFCKNQSVMDFTKENIENFVNDLVINTPVIINQTVIEIFDRMTSYDKKNKIYIEGWKSNDAWKVNKRVIIPRVVEWGEYCIPDYFRLTYYSERIDFLRDVDKVMARLSGLKYENINKVSEVLQNRFQELGYIGRMEYDNTVESTFFNIKFFKKGTIHLIFKDSNLLTRFNKMAAKLKGWDGLPDDYNAREKNVG